MVVVGSATDVGKRREKNEDMVLALPSTEEAGAWLCAVADGMGGHAAGEVASQVAIEALGRHFSARPGLEMAERLREAMLEANRAVWEASRAPGRRNMGTTLVSAALLPDRAAVANVGDSQAYLVSPLEVSQVTQDHSWVADQVERGLLSPEQARAHPYRNVLTRAVGLEPAVAVDLFEVALGRGRALVLCSDGLSITVEPDEIAEIVRRFDPAGAAQALVDLANERGGWDNVSVVVAKV